MSILHEVNIFFPDAKAQEKMLVRSLRTSDLLKALRVRGSLHNTNAQLDIEENDTDYIGGYMHLSDVITGERIVSVMW